jgi:hypothetical protein
LDQKLLRSFALTTRMAGAVRGRKLFSAFSIVLLELDMMGFAWSLVVGL